MTGYSPPSGPPPPKVPHGWKAIWDTRYSEYFFANTITGESTWHEPTQSATNGNDLYNENATQDRSISSNNPYRRTGESDEAMARRLQNEEHSRQNNNLNDGSSRGEVENYYNGGPVSHGPLDQEGIHNGPSSGARGAPGSGFRDKIRAKMGSSNRAPGGGAYYPPPQTAPMGYHSGPMGPPMGAPMYAPPFAQPYGYGMQPQPMYMQQPMRRRQGMGPGGGAALGLGGGLLGGMMLGNAMNSGQQDAYQDGFADGADYDGGDMDCGDCGE